MIDWPTRRSAKLNTAERYSPVTRVGNDSYL
jgi:hypothetical protein